MAKYVTVRRCGVGRSHMTFVIASREQSEDKLGRFQETSRQEDLLNLFNSVADSPLPLRLRKLAQLFAAINHQDDMTKVDLPYFSSRRLG